MTLVNLVFLALGVSEDGRVVRVAQWPIVQAKVLQCSNKEKHKGAQMISLSSVNLMYPVLIILLFFFM